MQQQAFLLGREKQAHFVIKVNVTLWKMPLVSRKKIVFLKNIASLSISQTLHTLAFFCIPLGFYNVISSIFYLLNLEYWVDLVLSICISLLCICLKEVWKVLKRCMGLPQGCPRRGSWLCREDGLYSIYYSAGQAEYCQVSRITF